MCPHGGPPHSVEDEQTTLADTGDAHRHDESEKGRRDGVLSGTHVTAAVRRQATLAGRGASDRWEPRWAAISCCGCWWVALLVKSIKLCT